MSPFIAKKFPGRIFINYRREECGWQADRLCDQLVKHFNKGQVFKDIDSIKPGDDFIEVITKEIGSCHVLLALIGDKWLTITDKSNRRRLRNTDDPVRLELETALRCKVRIVPILIDGARMPLADELPASLADIVHRHAFEVSRSRFNDDVERLLAALDEIIMELRASPQPPTADDQVQARSNVADKTVISMMGPSRPPTTDNRQRPVLRRLASSGPPSKDDQEESVLPSLVRQKPEPNPEPVPKLVRRAPERQSRSKRSGKR
jgi:TIR domain-containing protein